MIRLYILQPTKHKAVRLLPWINFSKVQWETLISITLIIIELLDVLNPLQGNCVGCFFHLNTGINFGPNILLFPRALEGGPITWVRSAETPRFHLHMIWVSIMRQRYLTAEERLDCEREVGLTLKLWSSRFLIQLLRYHHQLYTLGTIKVKTKIKCFRRGGSSL